MFKQRERNKGKGKRQKTSGRNKALEKLGSGVGVEMKYLLAGVRAGHINNSGTLGLLSGMLPCIYGVEGRGRMGIHSNGVREGERPLLHWNG